MSSYSELIKNFEKIRAYMRDFYVYGFKSREDYTKKSARSYDDERRRIESWLGAHIRALRTPEGKTVFLSIDTRVISHNPLFRAWQAKSFTDGDITLHFILFDLLHDESVALSLAEILSRMDAEYLSRFSSPMLLDESTLRKKLSEYVSLGMITATRVGRRLLYRRVPDAPKVDGDLLDFFSEVLPCGVLGAYLADKAPKRESVFGFKHHYITSALDGEVLAALFAAMREGRAVTAENLNRRRDEPRRTDLIPLRVFISAQNGRQHLLAYLPETRCIRALRVDYLSHVKQGDVCPYFAELRAELAKMQKHMWGVSTGKGRIRDLPLEHVEFTLHIGTGEDYILSRLLREGRCGTVTRIDQTTYRFVAEVVDTNEMLPWIRTFTGRILQMNFSNRTLENRFKADVDEMYRMYGVTEWEVDE